MVLLTSANHKRMQQANMNVSVNTMRADPDVISAAQDMNRRSGDPEEEMTSLFVNVSGLNVWLLLPIVFEMHKDFLPHLNF